MLKKGDCISYKNKAYLVIQNENVEDGTVQAVNEDGQECELVKAELGVLPTDIVMADRETLDHLVRYAFKYALGKSSYAPHDVVRFIKTHPSVVSYETVCLIEKELKNCLRIGKQTLGTDCEAKAWLSLFEFFKHELP